MARTPLMQSSGGWDREAVPVVILDSDGNNAVEAILQALADTQAEVSALSARIDAMTTGAGALRVDGGASEGGLL